MKYTRKTHVSKNATKSCDRVASGRRKFCAKFYSCDFLFFMSRCAVTIFKPCPCLVAVSSNYYTCCRGFKIASPVLDLLLESLVSAPPPTGHPALTSLSDLILVLASVSWAITGTQVISLAVFIDYFCVIIAIFWKSGSKVTLRWTVFLAQHL